MFDPSKSYTTAILGKLRKQKVVHNTSRVTNVSMSLTTQTTVAV